MSGKRPVSRHRAKVSLFSFSWLPAHVGQRGYGRGGKEQREPETVAGALLHFGMNAKQTPLGGNTQMNGILSYQPDRGGIS